MLEASAAYGGAAHGPWCSRVPFPTATHAHPNSIRCTRWGGRRQTRGADESRAKGHVADES
eukprot:3789724-Prymnesium_polylepis.1